MMKKVLLPVLLAALTLLALSHGLAEGSLSGRIEGNNLTVTWRADCNCSVLTVYQNDWPVCVQNVNGSEGTVCVPIGMPSGKYSLRLQTDNGCLTGSVSNGTSVLTKKPTSVSVQTPMPTKEPTSVFTPKPTAKPSSGDVRSDLAGQVIALVNEERAKQGLGTLREDNELTRAARVRAAEIAQSFSHTRPDGRSWSTVSGSAYAENIAMGQRTADRVMAGWMSSQGHRENILHASYGSIGVCAYVSDGVTYWVQLFGK